MKTISRISSLFIFINITICAQTGGWFSVYSPPNASVTSLYFTNANTGYAVGWGGTQENFLVKTTNAGTNWFEINTQYNTDSYTFLKIYFWDNNTGFICVLYNGGVLYEFVIKTTDGGLSWGPLPDLQFIYDIQFVNSQTGYAVGGHIHKTINGGNTWFLISDPDSNASYTSLHFINDNTGYVTNTYPSKILRTVNGGLNWTQFDMIGLYPSSVHFINNSTGYVSGQGIIKTTNGGDNWSVSLSGAYYKKIRFTSIDTGYCIGNNNIRKTVNGGNSWYNVNSPQNMNYVDCFFVNSVYGYVIGQNVNYEGVIFKTTTGGENITALNNENEYVPDRFSLSQNYPNPFNPVTKIKYSLPEASFVTLKIYDILGREVEPLVNEQLSPGIYEVEWNAADNPSGVYYYELNAGGFSQTRKMMLIK